MFHVRSNGINLRTWNDSIFESSVTNQKCAKHSEVWLIWAVISRARGFAVYSNKPCWQKLYAAGFFLVITHYHLLPQLYIYIYTAASAFSKVASRTYLEPVFNDFECIVDYFSVYKS